MSLLVDLLEVSLGLDWVWDHGVRSWGPVDWADLTVLVGVLEGLDQTEGFLDVTADWWVVDGDVSDDTLVGDDEQTTVGVASLFDQDSVVLGDLLGKVRKEWERQVSSETTVLLWCVGPGQVGVDRVDRDAQEDSVVLLEGLDGGIVGQDFAWADEGPVQWVEEEDDVLALVVRKLDGLELLADNGLSLEVWSWVSYACN